MKKVLGLDLGTNSIGWAVIDELSNKIIGIGSRIFPEGVNKLGEGEKELSKNASRTANRGLRKQFFRRRLRKQKLLVLLASQGMCPLSAQAITQWKSKKRFPEEELRDWLVLNPYELRHKALSEQITLEELGRVFFHLIQRRGFLSNSRSATKSDEKGAIFKGDSKTGKIGISETQESIKDTTLGSYLYEQLPVENTPFVAELERVRNRYTTRQMYIDEFEMIWDSQSGYHNTLTKELKEIVGGRKAEDDFAIDGLLFFQRPLKSQKHLVGKCTFENSKTKCLVSMPQFEQFRSWQFVNTIECNGVKLHKEDREKVFELLMTKDKPSFKEVKKKIGKTDSAYKFNYQDTDKVVGAFTISKLAHKNFFGKRWATFSQKEQTDIWHVLNDFDDIEKLKAYALEKWGVDEETATAISKLHLKDGYASLSLKAITNILPFLEMGFTYDKAVVLGGIKNAFGQKWKELDEDKKSLITDNIEDIITKKEKGGFIKNLKQFLKEEFGLTDKQLKKLYHHSASISVSEVLEKLPLGKEADKEIQNLRNPVVITALFEVRRLVNELIERFGAFDEIKIEMARDMKNSKSRRNDIRIENVRLEKVNDKIKGELDYLNQRHTHDNILKYKLWEECQRTCPYTGNPIGVAQLFTGAVQIEHIIPYSRSLDDSFMNKTLCFADENRKKGDQTPFEFYSKQGDAKWDKVKNRVLGLFYDSKEHPKRYYKFKHFAKEKVEVGFIERQLNDTRFISKETKNYLSKVCDKNKITVSPGQATAKLRHLWGMNGVLNKEGDEKTRDDHRHHAVDALVVACTKRSFVQQMTKWNRYKREASNKQFELPWEAFVQDAEDAVEQILVSHRQVNRVLTTRTVVTKKGDKTYINKGVGARGQLHKETVYGKRQNNQGEEAYHVRKPIESLAKLKQLEKVVDPQIKKLIKARIEVLGGFLGDKKKEEIPKNTFFITNEEGELLPQIFLPNKNGAPVPVRKVRMKEVIGKAEQLKEEVNGYVNPNKNHHVLIYKNEQGEMKEEVVTFWKAVERLQQKQDLYQLPEDGKEVVETLQINDLFLLNLEKETIDWEDKKELKKHLYRVQKFTAGDYYFRKHIESSLDGKLGIAYEYIKGFGTGKTGWQTFNPIKVQVSVSGEVSLL